MDDITAGEFQIRTSGSSEYSDGNGYRFTTSWISLDRDFYFTLYYEKPTTAVSVL
jgi:hypothetical protein